jgi:hypothetical protein
MATNRPSTPLPGLYYRSTEAGTTLGLHGYLTTALNGIITLSNSSLRIIYSIFTSKDDAVDASPLNAYFALKFNGSSSVYFDENITNIAGSDGQLDRIVDTPDIGTTITSVTIKITASREFYELTNGFQSHMYEVTIPISNHPGKIITCISSPNTYLRLPYCEASQRGALYLIKNTTNSTVTIGPEQRQTTTPIESASYTLNSYPQLRLLPYQCVGLLCEGTRWYIVLFFGGNPTSEGRAGGSTTTVAASSITSNILYGNINSQNLQVTLPAAATRQMLMIIAERTQDMFGYQLQLNKPTGGNGIDGRWSELNLNITSNRHGNAAFFLISDGATWHIASIFEMSDMDNYGTLTPITPTAPVSSAIGINTTGAVTSNVWSGRSYDVMGVTPSSLADNTACFRIFKEDNSAAANGFGLKSSDGSALFTNSYSGPDYNNSNTQMFIYGSSTLQAMWGLEVKRPGAANRIYFLGQYPTKF